MKNNEMFDSEDIYQDRTHIHKTTYADNFPQTDMKALYVQAKGMMKAGKKEEEIIKELDISSVDVLRKILRS